MSKVEFEEGTQSHLRSIDISNAVSHNTPSLVKWGLAKNTRQANVIMIITAITFIVVAIIIFVASQQPDILHKEDFTQDEINRMHPDMRDSLQNKK